MVITQKQKQVKLSQLVFSICILLLFMPSTTHSSTCITEMDKINVSVEEDRVKMRSDIDTACITAVTEMNAYCSKTSSLDSSSSSTNIKDSTMLPQDRSEILKRYALDRRASACLLPLLVEKYAEKLAALERDPKKLQASLTKIAQDLSHTYTGFLYESYKDSYLGAAITANCKCLYSKWNALAEEAEDLAARLAQTETSSKQKLGNNPSFTIDSFIDNWKTLITAQADIKESLVSLMKEILPRMQGVRDGSDTSKKEEYELFVKTTTEFLFRTEYINILDTYYFSTAAVDSPSSTLPSDFRTNTFFTIKI
ncbi:hypothetical protein NECID01_1117 [Nematocida sp. AWRm77]|nr:hypothetical protein NECID01_1117 [Nematocida sp. AWRm77]